MTTKERVSSTIAILTGVLGAELAIYAILAKPDAIPAVLLAGAMYANFFSSAYYYVRARQSRD